MEGVTAVLITREPQWPRDIPVKFAFAEVRVEPNCPSVLRRFELAALARTEHVYVQDDDAEIDIPALWRHYDGQRVTNAITPYHLSRYAGTGVTLLGWGAFFPKRLIDFSRWTARFGAVDPVEADRIFTYLARPHNPVVMPIRQVRRPGCLSDRPGHYRDFDAVLARLRELDA